MMIEHHEDAIEMAQTEQDEGTFEPAIELAKSIENLPGGGDRRDGRPARLLTSTSGPGCGRPLPWPAIHPSSRTPCDHSPLPPLMVHHCPPPACSRNRKHSHARSANTARHWARLRRGPLIALKSVCTKVSAASCQIALLHLVAGKPHCLTGARVTMSEGRARLSRREGEDPPNPVVVSHEPSPDFTTTGENSWTRFAIPTTKRIAASTPGELTNLQVGHCPGLEG